MNNDNSYLVWHVNIEQCSPNIIYLKVMNFESKTLADTILNKHRINTLTVVSCQQSL